MDDLQKALEMRLVRLAAAAALGMLALFLVAATVYAFKSYRFVGSGVSATNSITVSGMGEVFAVPDTATFSVSVRERAGQVEDAQEVATQKANDIITFLKGEGIEEKDIKTTDYSIYPQYKWVQDTACSERYCPPGRQELVGFEVSQTFMVKVRDTEKAGELLSGVGSLGVSEVSSISFTIDDEDALRAEARSLAIEEAREKAEELAEQLGVRLVRVVGFYEDSYGYPVPYYSRGSDMAMPAALTKEAAVPELPVGENKITSSVNVTYEIQ